MTTAVLLARLTAFLEQHPEAGDLEVCFEGCGQDENLDGNLDYVPEINKVHTIEIGKDDFERCCVRLG